ncbi:MAG TPA: site-specific DNA-methyltransferase [Fimbriimonadaceae bacterium]|nr:site-specific DNA-methyltransferase [Fimbriimonadaceae bacterium]HRJ95263.1 site-specific DNA-methyltransferase [Fimbriimonadaceae bacterium]
MRNWEVVQQLDPCLAQEFLADRDWSNMIVAGEAAESLRAFPRECIDCCMTSPPYYGHREYATPGIGQERTPVEYIDALSGILREVKRVLRRTGSLWLNIGDTYRNKHLLGIPWRVALKLGDSDGWILRNAVVWNKVKGSPDNSVDKLRNVYEMVFHFVKDTDYYYDVDAIRSTPKKAQVINGSIVSATGVSGVRYRRQVELSSDLSDAEKSEAFKALEAMLQEVREGRLADFRMIIRGQQRTTHSDSENVSGRARELRERGFYFLRYHPNGSKPSDLWDIIPEDTQKRESHFAPYPADLCRIPILATCPLDGIMLDPFCGTGTTLKVANELGRRAIGIDVAPVYAEAAYDRLRTLF